MIKNITLSLFLLFAFFVVTAQKTFSEGEIIYNVTIERLNQSENGNSHAANAVYTILKKGNLLRKELKMNNGFEMVLLTNNSGSYSLKKLNDKYFAIKMNEDELEKNRDGFEGFNLHALKGSKKVSGYEGQKGIITYKNGSSTEIVYATDWEIDGFIFDRFPGIKQLPILFDYKNEDGSVTHFKIAKITARPVETSSFEIPARYKLLSPREYAQMKKT